MRGALNATTDLIQAQLLRVTIVKGVVLDFGDLMISLLKFSNFLRIGILYRPAACGLLPWHGRFLF